MTTTHDPVCGMTIDDETAAASSQYEGRTYFFCSPSCKEAFERTPGAYLPSDS